MMVHADTIVVPIHDSFLVRLDDLPSLSEALQYAEGYAAKQHGIEPRKSVLLESESLGSGAFTDQALRSAFGDDITKTTWDEVAVDVDAVGGRLLSVDEARIEGFLEDAVIHDV